jgi:putative FmdB family regulatory protein
VIEVKHELPRFRKQSSRVKDGFTGASGSVKLKTMPLYEYFCDSCQVRFEEITSLSNGEKGICPQCPKCEKNTRRLISRFAVGGQGDLRESTSFHGCEPSSHSCGSGCSH